MTYSFPIETGLLRTSEPVQSVAPVATERYRIYELVY